MAIIMPLGTCIANYLECLAKHSLDHAVSIPLWTVNLYRRLLLTPRSNISAAIYAGSTIVQLLFAVSAMATIMVLRSLLGFALPLIAPSLLLAFITVFIGIPSTLFLCFYSEQLRDKSTYARDT
ncbi:hypothetical protein GB937_007348 [Aspergillus fischeri]|nr:hypothetical protein GB937_007348 [Aspergillus fischeri]